MTEVTLGAPLSATSGVPAFFSQTAALSRRAILGTFRQPSVWFPGFFFPLLIAAVNSAAMGKTIALPGFPPVDSFLQFLLPASIIQGVLFGGIVAGTDMALDIQDGFFERLVAAPTSRVSILVGRLAGAGALGAIQALVFIAVFSLFGAHVDGGVPSMLVLVLLGVILAIAIGGLTAAIGLRTGQQEAVQNSFPLIFVLMFLSSAFFPTQLMSGWYQTVARVNPLTWLIDAARSLVIDQFSWTDAFTALGLACIFAVLAVFLSLRQLQRRLRVAA
jgi:ABC-2 type transport system permease protein